MIIKKISIRPFQGIYGSCVEITYIFVQKLVEKEDF